MPEAGCGRRESNPHARRHQLLRLAWLPLHHSRVPGILRGGGATVGRMADLEALRRFGVVLEMAEAAGDGDWAGWTAIIAGLDEDLRADVVRQSSLVVAMLCEREAERRGVTRDQFLAQFRAEVMEQLG